MTVERQTRTTDPYNRPVQQTRITDPYNRPLQIPEEFRSVGVLSVRVCRISKNNGVLEHGYQGSGY